MVSTIFCLNIPANTPISIVLPAQLCSNYAKNAS